MLSFKNVDPVPGLPWSMTQSWMSFPIPFVGVFPSQCGCFTISPVPSYLSANATCQNLVINLDSWYSKKLVLEFLSCFHLPFFFFLTCKTRLSFQAFPHDRPKLHYYFFESEEVCNWYPYRNSSFKKTDLRPMVKPQGLANLQETETAARHISSLWVIYSRTEIMYS